ncbi:MAG TPA: AAA family ATPase [Thermoanaerobaculia bacterium]|nr:AAA family ATPase [Thermoanaerobaculia bacterium]
MRLTRITAHSFRNLAPDPIFFGCGTTLIAGENAQGKTNLLEAVALVCGQRSFRRGKPAAMSAGPEGFRIDAVVARGASIENVSVAWSPEEGRSFSRAGKNASFREVSRLAPAVFLSPEHRELLTGSRSARRRFLDRLSLLCRPAAGEDLARFERALAQRNVLLARARDGQGRGGPGELDAWTEEFVLAGAAVRRHRRAALLEWTTFFGPLCREAGQEYSSIQTTYLSDGESEENLRATCARVAAVERRRGHSLTGPQRDDLIWERGGRPLSETASAGELARTIALVKLAEWRAIAKASDEAPLFAADEFDAGLSESWVEAFLEALPAAETVLLTTASDPAKWRGRAAAIVEMRSGEIVDRPRAVGDLQDKEIRVILG